MSKIEIKVLQQFKGQVGTLTIGNQTLFGSLTWALGLLEDEGLVYDQDIVNTLAATIEHCYFSRDMDLNTIESEFYYKLNNLTVNSLFEEFNELGDAIVKLNVPEKKYVYVVECSFPVEVSIGAANSGEAITLFYDIMNEDGYRDYKIRLDRIEDL